MTESDGWSSPEYVATWVDQDTQERLLALPRRISAALVDQAGATVGQVVDLGSGPGVYLAVMLEAFPGAEGVWVDDSVAMEEVARSELAGFGDRVRFVQADASHPEQLDLRQADVVTTSRMVHHFAPDEILTLYRTVRAGLGEGGFFFNLDHFGSPEGWEARYRAIRGRFIGGREEDRRSHRHDHPFHPLDAHVRWMEEAGFAAPDVPWKTFFTALLAAHT